MESELIAAGWFQLPASTGGGWSHPDFPNYSLTLEHAREKMEEVRRIDELRRLVTSFEQSAKTALNPKQSRRLESHITRLKATMMDILLDSHGHYFQFRGHNAFRGAGEVRCECGWSGGSALTVALGWQVYLSKHANPVLTELEKKCDR